MSAPSHTPIKTEIPATTAGKDKHIRKAKDVLRFLSEEACLIELAIVRMTLEEFLERVPELPSQNDPDNMLATDPAWAANFLATVKASMEAAAQQQQLPPAPGTSDKQKTATETPIDDARWTAAKEAIVATEHAPDSIGWKDGDARHRITTDSPSTYCLGFRAWAPERRKMMDKLKPRDRIKLASPPLFIPPDTKGLTAWDLDTLREEFDNKFWRARLVYIQSYIFHKTNHAVSQQSIQDSIEQDANRLQGIHVGDKGAKGESPDRPSNRNPKRTR